MNKHCQIHLDLIHDINECISLYSVGGSLNLGFGNSTSITSKYTFTASGDFTALGRITSAGITSTADGSFVNQINTWSSTESRYILSIAGFDNAYLYNSPAGYGIWSASGGYLVRHDRFTSKKYFADIDSSLIVQNSGGSYNIKAAGLSSSPGTAPHYSCRAWVQFDGTTMAIYGSGNVSSITDNANGNYTVNFSAAMPDANYAVSINCARDTSSGNLPYAAVKGPTGATAGSVWIGTGYEGAPVGADMPRVFVAVFR